jgi:hypothetical protein
MQHVGFGPIWVSSSTKVLLHGIPGGLIQHRRGLRQGEHFYYYGYFVGV